MLPPSAAGRRAERVLHHAALAEHAQVARERVGVGLHQAALDDRLAALVLDDRMAVLRRAVRAAAQRAREDAPRRAEHAPRACRSRAPSDRRRRRRSAPGRSSSRSSPAAARAAARSPRAAGRAPPTRRSAAARRTPARSAGRGRRRAACRRARAAATIASASSSVSAIGFSSSTCLPAAKARSAASRCCGVGRQMSTTSTSSRCERRVEVVGGLRAAQRRHARGALVRARRDGDDPRAPGLRGPGARVRLAHEAAAHDRDVDHPRPSAFRCEQARAIDALTSSSGGHGSPWNSISTESGPV